MFGLFKSKPPAQKSQRAHRRHPGHGAEVLIAGHSYAMRDWSHGGVQIALREDNFIVGQHLGMTLRFRTDHIQPLETMIHGKVLRVDNGRAGISFANEPGPGSLRCFRQVADFTAAKKTAI